MAKCFFMSHGSNVLQVGGATLRCWTFQTQYWMCKRLVNKSTRWSDSHWEVIEMVEMQS